VSFPACCLLPAAYYRCNVNRGLLLLLSDLPLRRKIMDTIKIDKGPVRRRKNHYKGRHDDSSTMTIILQVVRKTG
ncbi:hypothetical protein LEMLEM_LOCUS21280, partial [Lemmus lemmus]